MDKLIETFADSFSKWDRFGQGLFLLIVLSALIGVIWIPFKFVLVLVRGWPPPNNLRVFDEDEKEDK